MLAPLIIIVYWKPYELHCGMRFERNWQGPIPEWCYDKLPNVYTYIQLKYWENRFLGFLYRGPENFLVAIPTNVLYITMTYRVAKSHSKAFFSLGIFGSKSEENEERVEKKDVLRSAESIPHIWYMAIQLTLVLLYANADINSRVASTLPIYYWGFASLVLEAKEGRMSKMAIFACFHNILYMILNVILFHTEIAFF